MSVTITIPDDLAGRLRNEARAQNRSVDELAAALLSGSLAETDAELEELIARIKATPPYPAAIRPATGSLAEALAAGLAAESGDEGFDPEEWQRRWAAVEQEMKAVTRANDIAEGRG
jgi:hypothetical protein